MTREEREAFLAAVHVGVLSVAEEGRGPCSVPVWYSYAPGGAVRITIGDGSRKAALLRKAGRASLCAQVETLPYQYVTVEGPIELLDAPVADDQRRIAERYLGPKLAAQYLTAMAPQLEGELLLTLRPERWWSADFSRAKF